VRDLGQDAGTVAGLRIGGERPAVPHVRDGREGVAEESMAGPAGEIREESHPASITLVCPHPHLPTATV